MHNLISFNQLMGSQSDPHDDLLTEYYECLIECNDDQHICKRICKEVLIDKHILFSSTLTVFRTSDETQGFSYCINYVIILKELITQ